MGRTAKRTKRTTRLLALVAALLVLPASTAYACGFLVAENGAIRLDEFSAASILNANGDAHYVTAFSFNGSPESFGAIIPLPAIPYEVEKAPGWFLQRLTRETTPQPEERFAALTADSAGEASVIATYEVESLDITILEGGGDGVLQWAAGNGYDLGVADGDAADLTDAIAMLDFYGERSPIFAAIKFDNQRAIEQDLNAGEGIPVRFSFHDQDQAWIPVKVLGFDKPSTEVVVANLFLLTPDQPVILGGLVEGTDVVFQQDYDATSSLVFDLQDDERADWVPSEFTLTRIDVRTQQRLLDWDIAARVGDIPDPELAFGVAYVRAQQGQSYDGNAPLTADAIVSRGELGGGTDPVAAAAAALVMVGLLAGVARFRRIAEARIH